MSWDFIDELPVVGGYDLPELARRALFATLGSNTVGIYSVIQHKSKLKKCFRIMEKHGIVENLRTTYRKEPRYGSYGSYYTETVEELTMDVREDFLAKAVAELEMPEWALNKSIASSKSHSADGSYLGVRSMTDEQKFHRYHCPDQYASMDVEVTGYNYEKVNEVQYLPRKLLQAALAKEYFGKVVDFMREDMPWVATNLYGLSFEEPKSREMDAGNLDITDEGLDIFEDIVKNTARAAEVALRNLPFLTMMAEDKKKYGEGLVDHLTELFLDYMASNATSLINEEGDLGVLVQGYLESVHLVEAV